MNPNSPFPYRPDVVPELDPDDDEPQSPRFLPYIIFGVVGLIALIGVSVGVWYLLSHSTQRTETTDTTPVTNTVSQDEQIKTVIKSVTEQLPSLNKAPDNLSSVLPHRRMGNPYNIYAVGTLKPEWQLSSERIDDLTKAASITKTIHEYFVDDQKASVDRLLSEGGTDFLLSNEPIDNGENFYRYTTDAYTCGLSEVVTKDAKTTKVNGAVISMACSSLEAYTLNAATQKPYYDAYLAANTTANPDTVMFSMPGAISNSQSRGYKVTTVSLAVDGSLEAPSVVHFYQGTDQAWHYFTTTRDVILSCDLYDTDELRLAYYGERCNGPEKQEVVKAAKKTT